MNTLRSLFAAACLAGWLIQPPAALAQDPPPVPKAPAEPAIEATIDRAVERVEKALEEVDAKLEAAQAAAESRAQADREQWKGRPKTTGPDQVLNGQSITIRAGEVVPSVVVINGSATVDGEVTGDVVVILGKARINGKVWGNVVNVGEGLVLGPGARVRGDAVGVLGGLFMGTNSVVGGSGVGIVGGITKQEGARIHGDEVPVAIGNWVGPEGFKLPGWVKTSLYELVFKLRPLSFAVSWVWVVWAIFLGVYLMFGLLFPRACTTTANILGERGLTSFLVGLLMVPLIPLVTLILTITGIGLIVMPFLGAAVFLATLLGKAALLLYLGNALGRQFKTEFPLLVAILLGAIPLTLMYLVPFLGFALLKLTDMWALGAVTVALFAGWRSERPPVTPAPTAQPAAAAPLAAVAAATVAPAASVAGPVPAPAPDAVAMGFAAPGGVALAAEAVPAAPASAPVAVPLATGPTTPAIPEALSLPRVGFKDRFWATCIDWLILVILCGPMGLMRFFWLLFPAYFAAMWVWKQTTLGGIVLRLKVVRLDGRPVDWPTAVVRALGALFGSLAAGLGYFWAGWDAEKQGWHDKIAGTVVVKVAKSVPLV